MSRKPIYESSFESSSLTSIFIECLSQFGAYRLMIFFLMFYVCRQMMKLAKLEELRHGDFYAVENQSPCDDKLSLLVRGQ